MQSTRTSPIPNPTLGGFPNTLVKGLAQGRDIFTMLGEAIKPSSNPQAPSFQPLPYKPGQNQGFKPTPLPMPARGGQWQQFYKMRAGADRPGVSTNERVKQFVGTLGMTAGMPLEIGTGTNHNQFTVNGNQSDHWEGNAVDIPAEGTTLTRLGKLALRRAGMKPADIKKANGGIYNIGNYQIIFNTTEGGNHWNHLHVAVRG